MNELPTYELEAQYFGFLPTTIIDLVINAVNDYVLLSADSLKDFLLENPSSPFREEPEHVWKAVTAVVNFVQDAVDKYFDKFELYCFRNVFKVPEEMPVPGDLPSSSRKESANDPEIQQLLQEIQAELQRNGHLRKELRHLRHAAHTQTQHNQACEDQLRQTWTSGGGNLLQDHIVYLWEQVEGIKEEAARVLQAIQEHDTVRKQIEHSSTDTNGDNPQKRNKPTLPDEVVDSL
eukprot:m.42853 g.42853  ORF g.42853 m.42853 type:complete len:234 (-) comp11982_c0_seq1:252-953(-)